LHTQSKTWSHCLSELETELSEQQFNIWIKPLQATENASTLRILAPNHFVVDWLNQHYIKKIIELAQTAKKEVKVIIEVGSIGGEQPKLNKVTAPNFPPPLDNRLNPVFSFENFVEGKSNQLAKAAATQIAKNPGKSYNPLFIYGGVGLGKTHIMQAIGNKMLQENLSARVSYVHSERFVGDMVKGLQHNTISEFKRAYRSLDALLIDDIQFFAGKERSQEEFFHTFNALLEGQKQIVLTCDRYPKEVNGLEERLKSRFGWGLTVAIEPPELETSVAILMTKSAAEGIDLPDEVAFFIAKSIRSNVRELEGALRKVIASSRFTGREVTVDLAKECLRDLLSLQSRQITLENIQKITAEYFNIRVSDLHSKRRSRSITRPRQLAMSIAKELTKNSLPEIGESFGGRDHSTVIHACKKIEELKLNDLKMVEDYNNIKRLLML